MLLILAMVHFMKVKHFLCYFLQTLFLYPKKLWSKNYLQLQLLWQLGDIYGMENV